MKVELTNFALRHFSPKFNGTKIDEKYKDKFIEDINRIYQNFNPANLPISQKNMPFCRYIVIENTYNVKSSVAELTNENYIYLRSGYSARTENELPVLSRWLELPINNTYSKYIVCILYSVEQLKKEYLINYKEGDVFELSDDCDYGIVSIMGTEFMQPDPMPPITMMRNALGIEEGGNGVALDKDEYARSVEFWNKYVMIK